MGSDIDGEAAGDYSGRSLSLSSDGSTVAIGAKFNDGNGADAGHVRVYSVCFTSTSTDTISECQSYTWTNGVTYTSSDTIAKDTFVNAAGCDSIVTLNLTINYASTSTDSISSCVSYTWTNGVTYTSSDTIAKDTFVNAAGCDSIVTLNLIILNPSSDTLNISECYSYTSSSGNTWTSSGIYFDTLTNAAGCDSVITFNLTIGDTILPTVITSNLTVYLDTSGAASITSTDIDSNSFDNCGISSLFLDITSFDCNDVGANTVTLTATDVYSNVDSATAVVIVLDTIRPTVLTNNLTVYLDSSGTASISTADIDSSSFDNCSITSYTLSDSTFDCNETGANTIWLSITDRYGNIDSATAIVTVVDTITTTLLTNNLTVYLDTSGAASITTNDIDSNSFDNCSITLSLDIFNFDCNDVGTNTVKLTATDVSGNVDSATAVVTVVDTIRSTVLTNNPMVYLDASGAASITTNDINNSSFDNCGISSLSLDITSFDCNDVGTNTVKLTATDVNGNVDSATAVVIVVDTIRATVLTNNTIVYLDASGAASITTNDINNSSFDNCGIISLSLDDTSFRCNDVGANAVTLTATDVNGNVDAATAVVTVVDTIKPTVLTNNLPIYLNASGTASISNNDINNSSFDNCGISSLSLDITSFDCNDVGANTVVLTATDVNSNSRSATAIVIVLDTISPVILTVPNDITLGYCDALYTYSAPTASDNCSFTIAQIAGLSSGSKFPIGTTTNTFVVTDASGNQDVTSFDVTIIQEYLPFVLSDLSYCGNSTQVNLSQGRDSITFAGIGVGINAISFEPVIAGVGTHTITATFIDTMGCVTNGTFDIQVLEAPTVPNITRVASDKIRVDQEYESYQWYRNGTIIEGERAQLYRAMELGLYTVLAENGNKCYEISEGYEFGIPFQEDEVIQQNRVTVYPNPTEGLVFIEFKNGEDTHIVTLTNGLGVELIKVNTDQRVYRLDISNLAAGTYTVNVVSSTINESVQIIKK
ncbi:HYR domain-containing protein [bacterium]|nr:HYR domain-containing protein [bacterium]